MGFSASSVEIYLQISAVFKKTAKIEISGKFFNLVDHLNSLYLRKDIGRLKLCLDANDNNSGGIASLHDLTI